MPLYYYKMSATNDNAKGMVTCKENKFVGLAK